MRNNNSQKKEGVELDLSGDGDCSTIKTVKYWCLTPRAVFGELCLYRPESSKPAHLLPFPHFHAIRLEAHARNVYRLQGQTTCGQSGVQNGVRQRTYKLVCVCECVFMLIFLTTSTTRWPFYCQRACQRSWLRGNGNLDHV